VSEFTRLPNSGMIGTFTTPTTANHRAGAIRPLRVLESCAQTHISEIQKKQMSSEVKRGSTPSPFPHIAAP